MSAIETLREAAEKLRGLADSASAGPWSAECIGSEGYRVYGPRSDTGSVRDRMRNVAADVRYGSHEWCRDNAEFIAAMHPGIGLRVADMLDSVASDLNAFNTTDEDAERTDPEALELARTVLGES